MTTKAAYLSKLIEQYVTATADFHEAIAKEEFEHADRARERARCIRNEIDAELLSPDGDENVD